MEIPKRLTLRLLSFPTPKPLFLSKKQFNDEKGFYEAGGNVGRMWWGSIGGWKGENNCLIKPKLLALLKKNEK